MRAALLVFGYAAVLAWVLPLPLRRLSEAGLSPRLGLTAWLTALVSVLGCALAALGLLIRAAVAGWPQFARSVCESVSAGACPPAVYRSSAYEAGLAGLAFLGGVAMIGLAWRYGRSLHRSSVRTRAHAEAARITGRRTGTGHQDGVFVLDAAQPAAYSVPGRPPAVVVTSGALAVLDSGQLTAVLRHERAHLAGRHHLLLAITRSLAAIVPGVPLFERAGTEVTRLAEMRADDVAARHGKRRTLLSALLTMGAGAVAETGAGSAPPDWLAATGGVIAARMHRLANPPARARSLGQGLALVAVTAAIVVASALVPVFALAGT
jgi:Zn-dependent protease with chaperone function